MSTWISRRVFCFGEPPQNRSNAAAGETRKRGSRIDSDAQYSAALDEFEQLGEVGGAASHSARARELSALICEYEARVTGVLVRTLKARTFRR